jgi:hypothetical protein
MIGVAVITDGVRDGIEVQTGNGCGATSNMLHEARVSITINERDIFSIKIL